MRSTLFPPRVNVRGLCKNRPEGFGPHSHLHPSLPTTCFLDVIVEPLPTWLLLLTLLALLPLRIKSARAHAFRRGPVNKGHDASRLAGIASRAFSAIYYLLIVAMLAMTSLEIARLVAAELGIGLLPFLYVGILLVLANRITWRARTARAVNVGYWVLMVVVTALKTAAEQKEQEDSAVRRVKDVTTQGKYPTSDEVLDNAVMVGVQAVLAVLEFNGWGSLASV